MRDRNIINLEQTAIQNVDAARRAAEISERMLGQKAFPDAVNPWSRVHALRTVKSKSGAPLRIRLGDFCALCQALGLNPGDELKKIWATVDKS